MICQHCGNRNAHEVVAEYKDSSDYDDGMKWSEGYYYQLLNCKACREVSLIKYLWSDLWEPNIDWDIPIFLFPTIDSLVYDLPQNIRKDYESARKVRQVDPHAYAVMIGRLLEGICLDRKAIGKTLFSKLEYMYSQDIIPEHIYSIATSIRKLRNVGAHQSAVELRKKDIPLLDDLTETLLHYLYIIPKLQEKAGQILGKK